MLYRVCVTDDNEECASVLCEGLRLHQYDAVAAHSGKETLEICQRGGVDLVLLDVCLPDMSGYDVCRALKENPKTRDVIVVFVTVKGTAEDITKGYSLGATDYITKPYNLPMVMVRVDAALRKRFLQERLDGTGCIEDPAYTDHLTGLRNRRYLTERLQEEVEEAHRYNLPVSCAVFDLDEVRALDPELGPASLDDLLIEIAMVLRSHSRTFDILTRYDGTVFAAVLPHTPLDQAVGYASKIQQEIDATTFSDPSFPTQVKLSVGIVACRNGSARGAEYVLGEAMHGLLQAKSVRGDRFVARNLNEG